MSWVENSIRRGALLIAGAAIIGNPAFSFAGVSGGLTLLEAPGARAAALGEAFSMTEGDVTAAAYNPATLATLSSPQASLSYHTGVADDATGRIDFGVKNFGIAAGYYSAGAVDLLENGVSRSVTAQSDLQISMGTALRFRTFSAGIAGKYLSSQLIESDRATAWAGDAGILIPVSKIRISAAVQNIGTRLTYVDDGDRLPRIARAGIGMPFAFKAATLSIQAEAPYFMNEQEWRPAMGLEMRTRVLSFRAGYRTKTEFEGLSVGTGFSFGTMTLDYAFGFVEKLDARQRISLVYRFGAAAPEPKALPKKRSVERQAPGPWRLRMGDIE